MHKTNSRNSPDRARGGHVLSRTYVLVPLAVVLVATGCARQAPRLERSLLPPGTPDVSAILADLAANDQAIKNFRAAGTFTLESPDLKAIKRFKSGTIAFRRPADLYVVGRKAGLFAFRLTCVGNEFLLEIPGEDPYYRLEGERFTSVEFSVSPADIAREMFLPESWGQLKSKDVRMTDYDAARQTATLEIGPKHAPTRRVMVEGPPWHVVQSDRLENGQVIATTTMKDYRPVDSVLFPAFIDARFPGEETRMTFEFREIRPNTKLDDSLFDVKGRAREAGIDPTREPKVKPNERRRSKPR